MSTEEIAEQAEDIVREVLADRRYNFSYGSAGVRIGMAQEAFEHIVAELTATKIELERCRTDTGAAETARRLRVWHAALVKTNNLEVGFHAAARDALEV